MKKYLLLASVAALAFTSCSDQSTEFVGDSAVAKQTREITFAPIAKPTTRAIVEGLTYPGGSSFYVSAFSIPGSGTADEYFSNVSFSKDGSNAWWVGDTKQYWPLSPATLNFLAISSSSTISSFTSAGASIAWTHNASDMDDLMYGTGQGTVTQTGNALTYGNNVGIVFKHALAQVAFYVKVGNSAYASDIHITKIALNDMVTAGTFTLTNSTPTTTAAQSASGVWASTTTANTDVPGSTTYASTDMSTSLALDGQVLVPCKNTSSPFNSFTGFTVYFTINGNAYTYSYDVPAAEQVLEQGKKYVYDLTFNLTEIRIAPSVTDWDTDIDGNSTADDDIVVAIPGA